MLLPKRVTKSFNNLEILFCVVSSGLFGAKRAKEATDRIPSVSEKKNKMSYQTPRFTKSFLIGVIVRRTAIELAKTSVGFVK